MKVISRTGKAMNVARDWYNTYHGGRLGWRYGPDKEAIYEKLVALGDDPDPDAVDIAIGNKSWTHCICNECGNSVEYVIQVGQEPDYDSATASICYSCIAKIWRMVS